MKTKAPLPLSKLTRFHEKAIEAFAISASKPFEARARWLIERIKREIPQLGGIVSCNGDSWLVPMGYPKVEGTMIEYVNPHAGEPGEAPTYADRLTHALAFVNAGGDVPHVSAQCVEWLRELEGIATYCEDSRFHTLEPLATV